MDVDANLYDRDFVTWTQLQAERLRAAATGRPNAPIDWEHVAEEIEDLGKLDRRDLGSRLETIILHLLKLQCSAAEEHRARWVDTVLESRSRAHQLLEDSPSLRTQLDSMLEGAMRWARRYADMSLRAHGEAEAASRALASSPFTEDQVLGEWWPEGPAAAP